MKHSIPFAVVAICFPTLLFADSHNGCVQNVNASVTVDHGHPWRPPFGLDRVGSLPVARVQLSHDEGRTSQHYLSTYDERGRRIERHALTLSHNLSYWRGSGFEPREERGAASALFAQVTLASVPAMVVLEAQCDGRTGELLRQPVAWPEIEAEAIARSDHLKNPIDLGTILPPHDWLLLAERQVAIVDVAAISYTHDLPDARLHASFDTSGKQVDVALPLVRNRRERYQFRLPSPAAGDRAILRVRLTNGERELWRKDIRTMIAAPVRWPSFAAVETKLRYDAPIPTTDPRTGARLPSTEYDAAWDNKLKDVVVFLPNGSRFVFWRGANFIPFWAGKHNTGVLYQWSEDCSTGLVSHPDGSRDCPEPLFDRELRYSRVRVIESTASRVHVRWDYQPTDVRYEILGAPAAEDFYFYPDGFGTRVVTVPSAREGAHQLSEFIIVTPQSAYPFEVLPQHAMEVLSVDGGKERIGFPFDAMIKSTTGSLGSSLPKVVEPRTRPMLYRVLAHKDDPAGAIYFHPSDPAVPRAYPPFYDQGQLVTPTYWGNHWPLTRGKWTGWAINDQITSGPAHNSVAGWVTWNPDTRKRDWEVKPLMGGEWMMPDGRGSVPVMNLLRFAWMIAYTELSDEVLRDWARSFSIPPEIEVAGARLDIPSYSLERRALRLVAEQSEITIKLKPIEKTVNPVFEIGEAREQLVGITLNDKTLLPEDYSWDGVVLWIKATVDPDGAMFHMQFR